jgi:CheY-like chemotaxis protein
MSDLTEGRVDILLVDDDVELVRMLSELFTMRGFTVACAANGREALGMLRGGLAPSLIGLDLEMPVMDGWTFCRELADDPRLSSIAIAVISSSPLAKPFRRSDAGNFDKPLDVPGFLATALSYRDARGTEACI